ncbi:YebC-like protein [Phellopilus nigrolimitatus]|nr:YebC-like protein [Phellopilus nigrolimitatus]
MRIGLAVVRKSCLRRCFTQSHFLSSGHNKWSKIKDKKGAADVKKSSVYTKAARDITVAIRSGGSDPNVNGTLANILKAAKAIGVPKDNIEKAIARATGEIGKDANSYVVYEVMAYGSVGVIVECLTDNGTRTIYKLREIFNEYRPVIYSFYIIGYKILISLSPSFLCSCHLAPVKYMFDKIGRVQVSVPQTAERDSRIETILEAAGSVGGEDFEILEDSDIVEYFCPPESLDGMTKAISQVSGSDTVVSSESIFRAKDAVNDFEESLVEKVMGMKDALEGNEDCVRVWTTIDSRICANDDE